MNVIVFGVDEEALPAIVTSAWSRATRAETAWRRDPAAPPVRSVSGPPARLASEDSDFMTCPTILVDDGRSMW